MNVWQFLSEKLADRIPAVLMVVADSRGETPGRKGFKMVAAIDDQLFGTVGGGLMEHRLVELARLMLMNPAAEPMVRRQIHDEAGETERSGMICGGEQTVLLYPCRQEDGVAAKKIAAAYVANRPGWIELSSQGLRWLDEGRQDFSFVTAAEFVWCDEMAARPTIYIFGGGHVSLALSQILSMLELRIVVLDGRPDVPTLVENQYADEKIITAFEHIQYHLSETEKSYAVIMTPSHSADEIVLRQLVRMPWRYLGMMASPKKAQQILMRLGQEGVPEQLLQAVHTPVGLPIHSRTPAEIAVSIAAEIIGEKNTLER